MGSYYGKFMGNIWPKAPGNYSGPFWTYNFAICLWEKQKLLMSMISVFLDVSLSPKTDYFYLWRHQDTWGKSRTFLAHFRKYQNIKFVSMTHLPISYCSPFCFERIQKHPSSAQRRHKIYLEATGVSWNKFSTDSEGTDAWSCFNRHVTPGHVSHSH